MPHGFAVKREAHVTRKPRIYLLGASCSGVSTLGALLSDRLAVPLLDVDSFFWMPTDPPFTTKRPVEDRIRLIRDRQAGSDGWVLAGSHTGWGDALVRDVDLIGFVYTPMRIRMQRLDRREAERHGPRILPGGDMHADHLAFRDWAARYDDPAFEGRNRAQHNLWLEAQSAPVLRLDGTERPERLARIVLTHVNRA